MAVQVDAPLPAYLPRPHSVQPLAPRAEYVPGEQELHEAAFLTLENLPAWQEPQSRSVVSVGSVVTREPGRHVAAVRQNERLCEVWS
jgi:hypothetical protein